MKKVFIERLNGGYEDVIGTGLRWLGVEKTLTRDIRVTIKPNLTFPTYRKGVMTNPNAVKALVEYLSEFTNKITICESDSGGYNRFSIDSVFAESGISDIARRYGVTLVNMSHAPSRHVTFCFSRRQFKIPLPRLILDETDLFVTMPVPKIHMNTLVSMSVKNQWGVIQIPSERLRLHPYFAEVVYGINKSLPRAVSIIDGQYGLTRSGPMEGDVLDLRWLLMADDVFAADYVCCLLMGIDPLDVPYLRFIFQQEGLSDLSQVTFNRDHTPFISPVPFFLRRKWTDYPGLWAFKSRSLAYIGYESPIAGILHWLLYRFRTPFYDYRNQVK